MEPVFIGVVTSKVNKVIVAEVDAKVEKLPVSVGQRIAANEMIAKLDDKQLKAQLQSAKFAEGALAGDAGAAAMAARTARDKLAIERRLAAAGASPRNAVRYAANDAAAAGSSTAGAGGRYAQAKNDRAQLEVLLTKTEVRSPIAGVVTRIKLRDGMLATKGTPIAHVFDDSDLLIRFAVPREHRALIHKGQRVEFRVDGADQLVWATVTYVSDELEPPVNYTLVEADLDDGRLGPDELRVASNGHVRIADASPVTTRPLPH